MRVQKLVIDRPAVVAYFQNIPADKQEIALLHALEVGITELGVAAKQVQSRGPPSQTTPFEINVARVAVVSSKNVEHGF